ERLRKRERALLDAHRPRWLEELPPWAREGADFRRGFVEEVTSCELAHWLAGAEELVSRTPLRALRLTDCGRRLAALAACPHLARVEARALSQTDITARGAELLAASPHLAGLRRLDLSHNKIGTRGVKALAASEHLAGLRELLLGYNDPGGGEQGAQAL